MRAFLLALCLTLAVPAALAQDAAPSLDAPVYGAILDAPLTLTGEDFGTPGPDARIVITFDVGFWSVTPSTGARVLAWEDDRIVFEPAANTRSGEVYVETPDGRSGTARVEVFEYDWFDIPPQTGAPAPPLAITVGADGQVWVNPEFHRGFPHLDPTTGVVENLYPPLPPPPGPFASRTFGDNPTQNSVLGESVLVDPDGNVWFSQGGGNLYSGAYPNHSRIVRYDPDAPEGEHWRVYNAPGDWNEILGLAWDEPRGRMWVAQAGFDAPGGALLASFDPEAIPWDNDFDFSTSLLRQVCRPGEPDDDCYRIYRLPETSLRPAHVEVADDGIIWYTAYWGSRIGSLDPTTGEVIEYPAPEQSGTWFFGPGPWEIEQAPDGDILYTEFQDNTIARFDASRRLDPACRALDDDGSNPCITETVVPGVDFDRDRIHSLALDAEGRVWFGQVIPRDGTDASVGFVTPDGAHVVLLPSLGLFPADGAPKATGIAVDPTTGDVYFSEYWRDRIGRLHRIVEPEAAEAPALTAARADETSRLAVSAYPNPARGRVTVEAEVGQSGPVRVVVFDALGRQLAVLHDGPAEEGRLPLTLDASTLPPGVYVVRAGGVGTAVTARVVLID